MRHYSFSFFNFIFTTFGKYPVYLLKSWIKQRKMIIKNKVRIRFLKFCIASNIFPPHLYQFYKFSLNLNQHSSITRFNRMKKRFITVLLKTELNDAFRTLEYSQTNVLRFERLITRHIPYYICHSFFMRQECSLQLFSGQQFQKMDKKIQWLISKHEKQMVMNIKPVQYSRLSVAVDLLSPSVETENNKPWLFTTNNNSPELHSYEVNIDPSSFSNNVCGSSLNTIKDKWFINLSSTSIPKDTQCLLQLGDNFSLPSNNLEKTVVEVIKNIENNTKKFPIDTQLNIRNRVIPIINNLSSFSPDNNPINGQIRRLLKSTKQFIKNNPNVIFTRADKGNSTVALDKDVYTNKITEMLQDKDTYIKVNKNPIRKIGNELRGLLKKWRDLDYISPTIFKKLSCSDGILPRAYGLPKIHKQGCPFRIIVSSIDSPLYSLASYLQQIISKNVPKPSSHIDNSFQLVEKLSGTIIDNNHVLISLDVISLFTNIPFNLAIDSILRRWSFISSDCNIPKEEFVRAVSLVLNSTFFTFDNCIYQQTFGTPMGSPLSPIVADLVLRDLEERALENFGVHISFFYRYVDDIAMGVHSSRTNEILNIFNSFHPRLQFTIELGGNNLNFLDVTFKINNNFIEFDWFHKTTFSGRYLNFFSQHPLSQKRGTIIGMIDRAFALSHPKYHQKNLEFVVNTLLNNDYPLSFIFDTINFRLKYLLDKSKHKSAITDSHHNSTNTGSQNKSDHIPWFTIPFLPKIADKFKKVIGDLDARLSFFSLNKLREIIKVHKDHLPIHSNKNVVYKIFCKDCDGSYVGQTSRQLKTRITEHRNHIHRNISTHSVITDHRLQFNHEFDWDDVKILDRERYLGKRLISEMMFIKRQNNSLNLQSDTEYLHHAYVSILNKL